MNSITDNISQQHSVLTADFLIANNNNNCSSSNISPPNPPSLMNQSDLGNSNNLQLNCQTDLLFSREHLNNNNFETAKLPSFFDPV